MLKSNKNDHYFGFKLKFYNICQILVFFDHSGYYVDEFIFDIIKCNLFLFPFR